MALRITIEPGKRSGQPCVRGLRITVWDVLNWLAAEMTEQQILDDAVYEVAARTFVSETSRKGVATSAKRGSEQAASAAKVVVDKSAINVHSIADFP